MPPDVNDHINKALERAKARGDIPLGAKPVPQFEGFMAQAVETTELAGGGAQKAILVVLEKGGQIRLHKFNASPLDLAGLLEIAKAIGLAQVAPKG